MQKPFTLLASAAVAATLALPGFAQETTPVDADTVVATVGDTQITVGHMIAAFQTLPENYQSLENDALYDGILEQLIQQTALAESVGDDVPARVVKSLENEERALKANEALQAALEGAVTDEDVQAAYDAQFGDFQPETEYNASHILLETEEEAQEVKKMIEEGADFAETAREKSTGPSGPNGGNLGWFGSGAMVEEFEAATIALEAGEVSAPVQTRFGWHVIKLNEIGKTTAPTLEEERPRLINELQRDAATAIISGSTDAVTVEIPNELNIDPAVLRQADLLD